MKPKEMKTHGSLFLGSDSTWWQPGRPRRDRDLYSCGHVPGSCGTEGVSEAQPWGQDTGHRPPSPWTVPSPQPCHLPPRPSPGPRASSAEPCRPPPLDSGPSPSSALSSLQLPVSPVSHRPSPVTPSLGSPGRGLEDPNSLGWV